MQSFYPKLIRRIAFFILLITLSFHQESFGSTDSETPQPPKISNITHKAVRPLVLTASGGVSLGSYQAGVLFYALKHLRNNGLLDMRVATGASAGSVNALISVVEGCGSMPDTPQDSLFWKTWMPFGLNNLIVKNQITSNTILSRDEFRSALAEIRSRWMAGLSADCDLLFGVSTTRKDPLIEEIRPGLTIQRYTESFVVRIRGQGRGVPPIVENFRDPERTSLLLPLGSDAEKNFNIIRDLIYASTAIPLGFPPQPISYCLAVPGSPPEGCTEENARTDLFVDGGVLDNSPVGLAHRLAELRFGDSPERSRVIYGLASADNESYPERKVGSSSLGILGTIHQMFGDFVLTARGKQLSQVFDEDPRVRLQILINMKHLPLSGEHLNDFLGFAETDFRKFDFYLGMYDSRYTAKEGVLKQGLKTVLTDFKLRLPEDKTPGHWQWGPIYCLTQVIERPTGETGKQIAEQCKKFTELNTEKTKNYAALLQTSLNLFYLRCQGSVLPDPHSQALCRKIFETRDIPPAISPYFNPANWRPYAEETEFQYFMRTLGQYHFYFEDLGLKRTDSRQGIRVLETKLANVIDEIASKQPLGQSLIVRAMGYLGLKSVFSRATLLGLIMGVNTMALTMVLIFAAGLFLMILERLFPARKLPTVKGWWRRVVIINLLQAGVVITGGYTWEYWFHDYSLFHLSDTVGITWSVWIGYFVITFVYYFWHRWRHDVPFLWDTLHQIHHSPQRLETVTSFYKHPIEIFTNSLLISFTIYTVLGVNTEAGAWITLLTSYAEFFYHMNLKTPHWVGYILQRPESHRYHHELGKHYNNFSDLPLWDMLFGTFYNPKDEDTKCGFKPEREAKFLQMLLFRNVNNPMKRVTEQK